MKTVISRSLADGQLRGAGHVRLWKAPIPKPIVWVVKIGLAAGRLRVEWCVASPEPTVGVFTPAGTCPGRLRRHCVIGRADPGQNPSAVRSGSSRVRGRGPGLAQEYRRRTGVRTGAARTRASGPSQALLRLIRLELVAIVERARIVQDQLYLASRSAILAGAALVATGCADAQNGNG